MTLTETNILKAARRGAVERRRTMRELRHAATAGEFSVCLQPRRSLATLALHGAEASIRWPRRKSGITPSGSLLPLLEESGLMLETASWMLGLACTEAASWPATNQGRLLSLSLDMPVSMIADATLHDLVTAVLASSGLAPGRLEIELQECELDTAPDEMLLTLAALRDLGVGAALDHFGSVSAGLLTPKRLPFTVLKLDRMLTRDLPHDEEAMAAIEASIGYAHALGMIVVAMGVDTAGQREALLRLNCDEGQGALFGAAMLPDAFAAAAGPDMSA